MGTKIIAASGVVAIGGGALWLGSPERGEYYELAPEQAASMLVAAPPPAGLTDGLARDQVGYSVQRYGSSEVRWRVSLMGSPLAEVTADLDAKGSGTVVSVDYDFAETSMGNAARTDIGEAKEFLGSVLRLGMLEHVDSTLEQRPFSNKKLEADVLAYAAANPDALRKYVAQMDEHQRSGRPSALKAELEAELMSELGMDVRGTMVESRGVEPVPEDPEYGLANDPSPDEQTVRRRGDDASDDWGY